MAPDPTEGDVRVMFARLEAKLDVALAQHGARLDEHGRRIEDQEGRLRTIERTPTVSPRTLGWALGIFATALAAVSPFLDRLYS